jgi:hypothetical protein
MTVSEVNYSTTENAGFLRIRGNGKPLLTAYEFSIEVLAPDGRWIPIRGLCAATIRLDTERFVTADLTFELGALDLSGVPILQLAPRKAPSPWERLSNTIARWRMDRRIERLNAERRGGRTHS